MCGERGGYEANFEDIALSRIGAPASGIWGEVNEYLIALGLAVLLTLASFHVDRTHEIWGLESRSRASKFLIVRSRACRSSGFH
jgi:hypothetical protein